MQEWTAEAAARLDAFLGAEGRMLSRTRAQKTIEAGLVLVNGKRQKKVAYRLETGDVVAVTGELPSSTGDVTAIDLALEVLYEDDQCLVLQKPAGISVHPGAGMQPGETTVLHGLAFLFRERSIPFSADAVLVHRLDKETTGCLLVAKNAKAHQALQKQFESRTVRKLYLALVAGIPPLPQARVDSPIGRSAHDRTKMSVRGVGRMREAQTTYHVLAEGNDAALVECDLHTGRTHQVRVHLHSIGHPILGDDTYVTPSSLAVAAAAGVHDLCLHAWRLTFHSPADESDHAVVAPPPSHLLASLKKVGVMWQP